MSYNPFPGCPNPNSVLHILSVLEKEYKTETDEKRKDWLLVFGLSIRRALESSAVFLTTVDIAEIGEKLNVEKWQLFHSKLKDGKQRIFNFEAGKPQDNIIVLLTDKNRNSTLMAILKLQREAHNNVLCTVFSLKDNGNVHGNCTYDFIISDNNVSVYEGLGNEPSEDSRLVHFMLQALLLNLDTDFEHYLQCRPTSGVIDATYWACEAVKNYKDA